MKRILLHDNILIAALVASLCAGADETYPEVMEGQHHPECVVVQILSRGDHIPQKRMALFEKMVLLLKESQSRGETNSIKKRILGLEGEAEVRAWINEHGTALKILKAVQAMADALDENEKSMISIFVEECN